MNYLPSKAMSNEHRKGTSWILELSTLSEANEISRGLKRDHRRVSRKIIMLWCGSKWKENSIKNILSIVFECHKEDMKKIKAHHGFIRFYNKKGQWWCAHEQCLRETKVRIDWSVHEENWTVDEEVGTVDIINSQNLLVKSRRVIELLLERNA